MDEIKLVGGILCGGFGKRLMPLTNSVPKALLEIRNGYTILEHELTRLKYAGIDTVYLLAGYLHEKIREKIGECWNGIKLEYLIEDRPKGTLYGINNLLSSIDSNTLAVIMNGDIVTDANIKDMISKWVKGTITIMITPLISPYGIVKTIPDGKITSFIEKPKLPYYINGGIYLIPKDLEKHFKIYRKGDVERLIFPSLAKKGLIRYYKDDDAYWHSIDSIKDLEAVRNEFKNRTDKPWGYEKIITITENYMVKTLYIMKGYRTSLHLHKKKHETLHIIKGEGIISIEGEQIYVKPNDLIEIKPETKHFIRATKNLLINEYSTPHPKDVIRIEDPYGRT